MAAYGSLVSVMHIIDQLKLRPRPPISLDKKQAETLTEKIIFLQDFLEGYSHIFNSKDADELESRIADAAYAAEDVIESHIADQILAGSRSDLGGKIGSADLYQGVQKVIEDMDFIKKEAMEIIEKIGVQKDDQLHGGSSISGGSLRSASASTGRNTTMVGFDDVLVEVMDKLTDGQLDRKIIPIVGMGGSGKTTLARNVYKNQVVVQYFDILDWVTISQEHSMRGIFGGFLEEGEVGESLNEYDIGEKLHKRLSGRRYLIVLDDIWKIVVWDRLKLFFPDNKNGSRIMLTTRLSMLASQITDSLGFKMNHLDEETSWNLLCKNVFGEEDCPPEFEKIGRKIARNCKGLPLSIVVIGGILAKSKLTQKYWEHIAENLNAVLNLEDDEHCLQILYASYKQLPVHLKPCFLYMGIFPEDKRIKVSKLRQLWIAEGFLKQIRDKTLEEAAEEYVKELIDRNLLFIPDYNKISGKIKYCKIHDLLRDLCLREAQKYKFLCTKRVSDVPIDIKTERRICIYDRTSETRFSLQPAFEYASTARSLIGEFPSSVLSCSFRLLRVFSETYHRLHSVEICLQQVNLRYLNFDQYFTLISPFPSSIFLLWNIQTLIVHSIGSTARAPPEIWKMAQLRHVQIVLLELPDPPSEKRDDDTVLENLHTLSLITNFKCSEEVVKRIPNIKKLKICYGDHCMKESPCFDNIGHLHQLESLFCHFGLAQNSNHLVQNFNFPHSLKMLVLNNTRIQWEDLRTKIGSLPLLEVLKLKWNSCIGPHWETVEGQFCSLKFLLIHHCSDLEYWTTDKTHFPRLQHLVLRSLDKLEEIPSSIGDIPTLLSIQLQYCSETAGDSAKRILEEQEELGNECLQVQVCPIEEENSCDEVEAESVDMSIGTDGTSCDCDEAEAESEGMSIGTDGSHTMQEEEAVE